jgi:hypothetical protein
VDADLRFVRGQGTDADPTAFARGRLFIGMTWVRHSIGGVGPGTVARGHYSTAAPARYSDHQVIGVVSDAVWVMRRVLRR